MAALGFKKIQLDKLNSLSDLFSICSNFFGFCFLQNNGKPFIGLLPAQYWVHNSSIRGFIRQINGDYALSNHPFEPSFTFPPPNSAHNYDALEFNGGFVSFISYDYAKNTVLNTQAHSQIYPERIIAEYDVFIKQENQQWFLLINHQILHTTYISKLIDLLTKPTILKQSPPCTFSARFQPRWDKTEYYRAFNKTIDYLYAGDCYQINLTQEFSTKLKQGRLSSLLPELLALSKAPYAGYIAFEDFELLSCSPELFIEFSNNKLLKTRPIKGTLPRSNDPVQDEQLKNQLAESAKDQAENLMIVDLLRNDLSVYAETGSVNVPKLFEIESFAQVHHMVSEIHATLKPEVNPIDVLMSALPGGSITGAPKIRAMEIIEEIEGNARGAYCGSLGYFNYDGTGAFNILIRSIQRYGEDVSVWAGGGITVSSNVEAEYQETLDKVSAILDVLNQYASD